MKNLDRIELINQRERTTGTGECATYGITKFADYSEEEKSALLGLSIPITSSSEERGTPEMKMMTGGINMSQL